MKLLFKNTTQLTEELYFEFLAFHESKENRKYTFTNVLFILLFLFCMFTTFQSNQINLFAIFSIGFIIFLGFRFVYPTYVVQKEKNSPKIQQEYTNTFYFYETYFVVHTVNQKTSYRYMQLHHVLQTEDCFYLYLDEHYAFIVKKDGFSVGTLDDFSTFLHKKLPFKYKK